MPERNRDTCLEQPPLAGNLPAIRALCREFGVARLEAFGSVCSADFDPERSDIDFLVEYPDDYDYGPWLKRVFDLEERLADLLGRPVDVVMTGALRKKWFRRLACKTRVLVYDESEVATVA